MGEAVQTQNPLDLVGGFEAYQDKIYQEILKRVGSWTIDEIRKFDEYLTKEFPEFLEDSTEEDSNGLEEGLIGLIAKQRPLTHRNLEYLEDPLEFEILSLFREQLEPYIKKAGEYPHLLQSICEESDRIISERKAS